MILGAIQAQLNNVDVLDDLLRRVEKEVRALGADLPEQMRLKEAEFTAEQRRIANFLEFIGEGRGSRALGQALAESERRAQPLDRELDDLRRSRARVFRAPPPEWVRHRVAGIQEVLERRTERSALILRDILGTIRMEPTSPDVGKPYYRAITRIDTIAVLETPSGEQSLDSGSKSLRKWRRWESNPRPRARGGQHLRA